MRVSDRLELADGGGARAASAAGSIVSASPSKKRVMAICAFHWHFCRRGTADARSWSVTEVYCCSASCCCSLNADMSKDGSAIVAGRYEGEFIGGEGITLQGRSTGRPRGSVHVSAVCNMFRDIVPVTK
jgi:hypothetical protein